jgi:cytochrome c peroxidase
MVRLTQTTLLFCLCIAAAACASPIAPGAPVQAGSLEAVQPRSHEPISVIPAVAGLDPAAVALGSALFGDARLSHDDTVACASCHRLGMGGVDRLPRSVGINGQKGGRNAPTVFNSDLNFRQFWDGRAASLEDQIDGPIAHPLEMGSNWPEILQKLNASPEYVRTFASIYSAGITTSSVKNAVATFERSLNTPNSRFDRFLGGDTTALTAVEIDGYSDFKSFGCVSCHQGANVGGNMYQRLGIVEQPLLTNALMQDLGRFGVTGDDRDKHVFKVPGLRNVAVTPPYFNDGSVSTLETAVVIMGRYQLGRQLTLAEVQRLTAFLKTLTGEYEGRVLE